MLTRPVVETAGADPENKLTVDNLKFLSVLCNALARMRHIWDGKQALGLHKWDWV